MDVIQPFITPSQGFGADLASQNHVFDDDFIPPIELSFLVPKVRAPRVSAITVVPFLQTVLQTNKQPPSSLGKRKALLECAISGLASLYRASESSLTDLSSWTSSDSSVDSTDTSHYVCNIKEDDPTWAKRFKETFSKDSRWESRQLASNEVKLLSLVQGRSCMLDRKDKGGRSLIMRCASTVKCNGSCPFFVKVRRSNKDGCWHFCEGMEAVHSCTVNTLPRKRSFIGPMMEARETNKHMCA